MIDEKSLVILDEDPSEGENSTHVYYAPKNGVQLVSCKAGHPNVTVEINRKQNGQFNVPLSVRYQYITCVRQSFKMSQQQQKFGYL